MRNTNLRAVLFSLIAIVAACDAPEASPTAFRVFPGGYWSDGDKGCDGFLMKTESGAMCSPPCGHEACNVGKQENECGEEVGLANPVCLMYGSCMYVCQNDGDCLSGQRCDGYHKICVWENQPAQPAECTSPEACGGGEPFGPCDAYGQCGAGLECITKQVGTGLGRYCAPTCDACDIPAVDACVAGISDSADRSCQGNRCAAACEVNADCANGAQCVGFACVWPF